MAIQPNCDMCGNELTAFGAILFSPPDQNSTVKKFHVCIDCYAQLLTQMKAAKKD